ASSRPIGEMTMSGLLVALSLILVMAGSVSAETSEEVVTWYKGYAQLWSGANVNIDAVEPYYAVPIYFVGPDGAEVQATKELRRSWLAAGIETRKQRGINRGELQQVNATMLNPAAAFIQAEWARYKSDGSLIGDCKATWTYLAAKTKEGWKILSLHQGPCKPARKP